MPEDVDVALNVARAVPVKAACPLTVVVAVATRVPLAVTLDTPDVDAVADLAAKASPVTVATPATVEVPVITL
jgi:hypothetical protein